MKLALVLLACVAFVAAAPQERGVIEHVEKVVENAISNAHNDLDSLLNLVKALAENAKVKVAGLISNAKAEIASGVAGLESTIGALISKGGAIATCAQKNIGELSGFKDSFGKNVESCAGNSVDAVGEFEADVKGDVESLKSAISELVAIVEECSTNVQDAIICAVSKVTQVETLVKQIISEASAAVEVARGKATTAVAQIETCVQQTVGEATVTINKYVSAVKLCA